MKKKEFLMTIFFLLFTLLTTAQLVGEIGELKVGEGINSPNNQFRLQLQTDGNLVIYEKVNGQFTKPIWDTKTFGNNAKI